MKKFLILICVFSSLVSSIIAQVQNTNDPIEEKKEEPDMFEKIYNGLPYNLFRIIKHGGIITKYGKIIYNRETSGKDINSVGLKLVKPNGDTEIIWRGSNNSYNNLNGEIRNFYLDKDHFSFVFSSLYGLELIKCEKSKDGNWKEVFRNFIALRSQEGFKRGLNIFLPNQDKVEVIVYNGNPAYAKQLDSNSYKVDRKSKIFKNGKPFHLERNDLIKEFRKKEKDLQKN